MVYFIYLVQTPQYSGTNIFKVGVTEDKIRRFRDYGKGTKVIVVYEVTAGFTIESIIIRIFRQKFRLFKKREWFEGDCIKMKNFIGAVINFYENIDQCHIIRCV